MSLETMKQSMEDINEQAQELFEQAYLKGYKAGQKHALMIGSDTFKEQGRNEAWDAAKKICKKSLPECGEILLGSKDSFRTRSNIFEKFSASEAINTIRAYEEQKKNEEDSEIHFGDEVTFPGGLKLIVLKLSKNGETFDGLYVSGDGVDMGLDMRQVTKTGRTFPEIAEVLKKMQEEKE